MTTRVYLLHPVLKAPGVAANPADALAEACALVRAIDVDLAGSAIVPVPRPNSATLFGSGKVKELALEITEGKKGIQLFRIGQPPQGGKP